jgi:hypothetical protein
VAPCAPLATNDIVVKLFQLALGFAVIELVLICHIVPVSVMLFIVHNPISPFAPTVSACKNTV